MNKILYILLTLWLIVQPPPPPKEYKTYIPLIIIPEKNKYGIALADWNNYQDASLLNVGWAYDWHDKAVNNYQTEYIPMLWSGKISKNIPVDYQGYILFLNEPNLSNQANLPVVEAVNRYMRAKEYYNSATILCCGVSIYAYSWMKEFVQYVGVDGIHLHVYLEEWVTFEYVQKELPKFYELTQGEVWITEYNSLNSDKEFENLTRYLSQQTEIDRLAPYPNRQIPGTQTNLPDALNLVDADGNLTRRGQIYISVR